MVVAVDNPTRAEPPRGLLGDGEAHLLVATAQEEGGGRPFVGDEDVGPQASQGFKIFWIDGYPVPLRQRRRSARRSGARSGGRTARWARRPVKTGGEMGAICHCGRRRRGPPRAPRQRLDAGMDIAGEDRGAFGDDAQGISSQKRWAQRV